VTVVLAIVLVEVTTTVLLRVFVQKTAVGYLAIRLSGSWRLANPCGSVGPVGKALLCGSSLTAVKSEAAGMVTVGGV